MPDSLLSPQIVKYLETQSWIRRMFESAIEMKQRLGEDRVFDFSLGNPDVPPPAALGPALHALADRAGEPRGFGYVPNAGLPAVREALAERLADEQAAPVRAAHVVLTCGAAGALNVLMRSVLSPGDEVVCPSPFFVEYLFYAANYGGVLRTAPCRPPEFSLDLEALDAAIGPRTRVVLLNSPNNPTGQVYGADELAGLADLLRRRSARRRRPLLLVSDEPYRFLAYDGTPVPPLFPLYPHSVVAGSFSKSHSLAGERIGYLAVNPDLRDAAGMTDGFTLSNRILGFVNAPIVAQRLLPELLGHEVDPAVYDRRRRAMAGVLREAGIPCSLPKGAFYFFPRVPEGWDDRAFVNLLLEEGIIAVPGAGFGAPGFFRLAYCVNEDVIMRSAPAFARAMRRAADRMTG